MTRRTSKLGLTILTTSLNIFKNNRTEVFNVHRLTATSLIITALRNITQRT